MLLILYSLDDLIKGVGMIVGCGRRPGRPIITGRGRFAGVLGEWDAGQQPGFRTGQE